MAFKIDTFDTGGNGPLNSHTSDSGGGWTAASGGGDLRVESGVVVASSSVNVWDAFGTETPPSPDQVTELTVTFRDVSVNTNRAGLILRWNGVDNGYVFNYRAGTSSAFISKWDGTSVGPIADLVTNDQGNAASPAINTPYVLKFECYTLGNGNIQLIGYIDDVEVANVVQDGTSAEALTAAGEAGIYMRQGSGADDVEIDDVTFSEYEIVASDSVAFDAVSVQDNITTGTARSLTFSHTASGTDRAVYIAVAGDGNGWFGTFETVTYGGVNVGAPVISSVGDGGRALAIFEYLNPPTGAQNIVITFDSGGSAQEMAAAAISYTNVRQTGGSAIRDSAKESNASGTSTNVTVTSTTRDRVLNFLNLNAADAQGDATALDGQSIRGFRNFNGAGGTGLFAADMAGTASQDAGWTTLDDEHSNIALSIQPVPNIVITGAPSSVASGATAVSIDVEDSAPITEVTYANVDLAGSLTKPTGTTIEVDFPNFYDEGLDFKAHTFEIGDGVETDSINIALTLPASVDYYRTVAGYPPGGDEITFFDDASITAVDGDKFTIRDPSAIVLNVFNYGGFDADTLDSVFVRHLDISDTTDGPDGTWTNELEFIATSIDNLVDIGAIAQASTATITFDNAGSFFFTAEIQAQEATGDADFLLSGSNTIDANSQAQAATATLTLEMSQQMFAQVQAQAATAPFTLFSQSREVNMDVTAQAASAGMKFRVPITWIFEPDNFSGS